MKTLLVTIALAVATPVLADDFNTALQTWQVDQQLNNLAEQARRDNQNTFNQTLNLINPSPRTGCYVSGMRIC